MLTGWLHPSVARTAANLEAGWGLPLRRAGKAGPEPHSPTRCQMQYGAQPSHRQSAHAPSLVYAMDDADERCLPLL
ncbi:hypothetical protein NDU88_004063 [Pleurodeles waltl]|uniref:Uncharacterized protein n=1 Tax=Pleurodeles waltl TaxID=8319 RepID=A0AAV7SHU4_PLEWA|nr:hypothetical protein NDU88_004063 [Pleurodeles waltl]